jgi:hypothetical protein
MPKPERPTLDEQITIFAEIIVAELLEDII